MKKESAIVEKMELNESKSEEMDPQDHEVDSAMEDLLKAEAHKKNEKLMAKIKEKLGVKKELISSIQGLKEKRAKLIKEDK